MGGVFPLAENVSIPPTKKYIRHYQITISCYNPVKTSFLACSCTIFVLTSYSFYTQLILILIFVNVQHPSSSYLNYSITNSLPAKFSTVPHWRESPNTFQYYLENCVSDYKNLKNL